MAAPGFLNVTIADAALADVVTTVLAEPAAWGRVRPTTAHRVNVEFVSANPTGPLHIGNARGAFVGDLLCRVLEAAGHSVAREYYFNDFGAQVRNLGASVVALRRGEPLPEEAYRGAYVGELASEIPDDVWSAAEAGADPAMIVGQWASERVRTGIEASLAHLGVRFDVWKSEGSSTATVGLRAPSERLQAAGALFEEDGALWFRSTAWGDDKDRVVRKSNGDWTYFGSDIGYVVEKFSRGFDRLINIWGADHHGTVARLRNAASAMGYDREAVQMLLMAWVRFVRDGEEVSMSKRSGEFITLDDLLAEIGVDAARWFFAARGYTSGIDFDIELAKKQSAENPVYYVQYAHARIASILRKAAEAGLAPGGRPGPDALAGAPEAALVRALTRFPEVVEDAVIAEEPHGITTYATDLATQFHAFYRDARVVDPAAPGAIRSRGCRWCARHSSPWPARWLCWNLGARGDVGVRDDPAPPAGRPARESARSAGRREHGAGERLQDRRVAREQHRHLSASCRSRARGDPHDTRHPGDAVDRVGGPVANSAASSGVSQAERGGPARTPRSGRRSARSGHHPTRPRPCRR